MFMLFIVFYVFYPPLKKNKAVFYFFKAFTTAYKKILLKNIFPDVDASSYFKLLDSVK